jgi:pyruvate kinase
MLSGETAVGAYPVEAVACMHRIAIEAEAHLRELDHSMNIPLGEHPSIDDYITQTVVELADKIGADAIITPTVSGRTARLIARNRPPMSIVAPVPSEAIQRKLMLVWGVQPVLREESKRAGDDRMTAALKAAFDAGAIQTGQRVIVLAGHPLAGGKHLPTIRFMRVDEGGAPAEP